jgi:hypothetical protein
LRPKLVWRFNYGNFSFLIKRSKILDKELTKVTLETFIAWKKKKMHEKRQQQMQNEKSKLATFKSGKQVWTLFNFEQI